MAAAAAEDPLALDSAQNAAELWAQQIILAATNHEVATLRALLRDSNSAAPANVKDPDTGHTPLHAAISGAAADADEPPSAPASNGTATRDGDGDTDADADADADADPNTAAGRAVQTAQLLLQNGAIWNALDAHDETPGCLAWRVGQTKLYEIVVDAGVRTELLFQRLDGYAPLEGDEGSSGDDDDGDDDEPAPVADRDPELEQADDALDNAHYLSSKLTFTGTRLLDAASNAVMMEWERGIMARSVARLLPTTTPAAADGELAVLNIGHGMGIIDGILQGHDPRPTAHHIVEAHADVAAQARAPGGFLAQHAGAHVTLHEGRWQDVLPRLAAQGLQFDAIYFDTFAESYGAFRAFFEEYVIMLLKEGGRWGFFHGLGADRRVCYDVYTKVVEMDLFEAGFDVEWERVPVPRLQESGEWEGVRRSYWALDVYRLPTCTFLG